MKQGEKTEMSVFQVGWLGKSSLLSLHLTRNLNKREKATCMPREAEETARAKASMRSNHHSVWGTAKGQQLRSEWSERRTGGRMSCQTKKKKWDQLIEGLRQAMVRTLTFTLSELQSHWVIFRKELIGYNWGFNKIDKGAS